jgi:SAM-dependent methyltransferase
MNPNELKLIVREKYGEIAGQTKQQNDKSCCGVDCGCSEIDYTVISESYEKLKGYNPDADLGLGCGLPTQFAGIKEGDSVLDLGSGAGNDCFVARAIVGESGKVTGLDFTDAMLEKARTNAEKLGFSNVEFVKADIEEMPLPDDTYDVIISNCVLNLVPDKEKAFAHMKRVLKPGGHFCVSDVVIKGQLPDILRNDAELYVGCVSGAINIDEYLGFIKNQGFTHIQIHSEREISLPGEILSKYLNSREITEFLNGENGIFSITVSADKP